MSVVTSLKHVTAEKIAEMYKSRWAIESFFRWVKQNLNVPVLFGTTKKCGLQSTIRSHIAYLLLKWVHVQVRKQEACKPLSLTGFQRLLLCDALPMDWRIALKEIMERYRLIYDTSV